MDFSWVGAAWSSWFGEDAADTGQPNPDDDPDFDPFEPSGEAPPCFRELFAAGSSADAEAEEEDAPSVTRRRPSPTGSTSAASGRRFRPLRVLCLHGRGSNNNVTHLQCNHIQLSRFVQCDLLAGPFDDSAMDSMIALVRDESSAGFHHWHAGADWAALQPGLQRIKYHLDNYGPYDGLFGFSQGASMVTCLSRRHVWTSLGYAEPPVRFVICGCGANTIGAVPDAPALMKSESTSSNSSPKSLSLELEPGQPAQGEAAASDKARTPSADIMMKPASADDLIELPSLHLIGSWDFIRFSSSSLAKQFADPVVQYLNVGHELPMSLLRDEDLRRKLVDFLRPLAQKHAYTSISS